MHPLKHIIIALALGFSGLSLVAQDRFKVTAIHKTDEYETGTNHTLLVDLQNNGEEKDSLKTNIQLPEGWNLITGGIVGTLKAQEKKLVFISFYVPSNTVPGDASAAFQLKDKNNRVLQSDQLTIKIANSHKLEVNKIASPQFVQAGELIESRFEIKNNGNVTEEIKLSSRNSFAGEEVRTLEPDSTIVVEVSQETSSKNYFIKSVNSDLEVLSTSTNEIQKAYSMTSVFPVKIEQKDPFLRFPMQFNTFYNSYTSKDEHFSSMSFELKGNGFLDFSKDHYLNFILRGPNQNDIRRFGMNDQYSLIYRYKNKTSLFLGDHSYYINRLGFSGRYGMGFRLDQQINNWILSAFYTKPRLYTFNNTPLFGTKAIYQVNDSLTVGASIVRSRGNDQSYNKNIYSNPNEIGQILVLELDYVSKNTRIQGESSVSATNEHIDFAGYLSLSQRFGNFRYSGNTTLAGKNYFGTLNNSFRLGNNLTYTLAKWDFSVGQGFSRINQRLDPLFYSPEPSYENYYTFVRYRLNKHHSVNIRADQRIRKDQQSGEQSYHYKEHGLDYRYRYNNNNQLTLGFNGRIARTQNLLSRVSDSRTTYGHYFNANFLLMPRFTVRTNISHNYTNRYGSSDQNTNYFRYGAGFNYRISQKYRIGMNYNSGYSPEENYKKRDFVNASVFAKLSKNHQVETRVNYYANPGAGDKKEWYAFVKYSYSFGAPIKKVLKQGGVYGRITTNDATISLKGVQVIAAGNSVRSDAKGNFELNNLSLGTNYVIVDQSTLPANVVPSVKMPFKVEIEENQKVPAQIELVKAGNVAGRLTVDQAKEGGDYNLEGYLKLQNEEFTYYIESDNGGNFRFQHIVPGQYNLTLIKLKNEKKLISKKSTSVLIPAGEVVEVVFNLNVKERKIKFRNNNFKVGQ